MRKLQEGEKMATELLILVLTTMFYVDIYFQKVTSLCSCGPMTRCKNRIHLNGDSIDQGSYPRS